MKSKNLVQFFLILTVMLSIFSFVSATEKPKTHQIVMEGMKFVPDKIKVKKEDSITFTNKSDSLHNVVIKDLEINSRYLKKGESVTVKMTKKGKLDFYCLPHKTMGMKGVITVE